MKKSPAPAGKFPTVGSDGSKSPFIVTEGGVKVSCVVYMKILEHKVLPLTKWKFWETMHSKSGAMSISPDFGIRTIGLLQVPI